MDKSLGELLDEPVRYLNWINDEQARFSAAHAVQDSGLLNHVGPGATTTSEIATRGGFDPELTRRLVEFLAAEGVLEADGASGFSPTERSRALQNAGAIAAIYGMGYPAGGKMGEALRTGKAPFDIHFGQPVFAAFAEDPALGETFGKMMRFSTEATEPGIFALHTFAPFQLAVDVGGSLGDLLVRLLKRHPESRGLLFDLPGTIEAAAGPLAASGLGQRIETATGNFFEAVPPGGDLYLLKHILHDWSDAECRTILGNIRAAMQPGARVAVIERLIPDEYRPDVAYSYDIIMLIWTTGRERRLGDFEAMFADAGFKLDRVTANPRGPSVIEAVAV